MHRYSRPTAAALRGVKSARPPAKSHTRGALPSKHEEEKPR
jgi:hypothetical protein